MSENINGNLELSNDDKLKGIKNIELLYNVPIKVRAKLGSTMMTVEEILNLDANHIIQLDTSVGESVPIYANDVLFAYGEIVVVNEDIGVRITKIINNIIDAITN